MVRPKSDPMTHRTYRVTLLLNSSERLRLHFKASALNMKPSSFARATLFESFIHFEQRTNRFDPVFIQQLHYIGVNLNQIVKNAHIFKRLSPNVEALAERISKLIDEAMEDA